MNQDPQKSEDTPQNQDNLDIETLSTILTDSEIRPDILKELDEKKNISLPEAPTQDNNKIIYDTNLNSFDDALFFLLKNSYDFLAFEATQEYIKISCKKDAVLKEVKYIKYPVYLNILLKAKSSANLDVLNTQWEQKWQGKYILQGKDLDILIKTLPGSFWETLYVKAKISQEKAKQKPKTKQKISPGQAFGFLGVLLFVALILWGAFLAFVITHAQTPADVSFFSNLWISLNDINSFLLKLTTFVFSIVVIIEIILLVLVLFKAFYTKKELKTRRIALFIASGLVLSITFASATLWMYLDRTIKSLPNWLELSYGLIQIYDNNLLNTEEIGKDGALISDTTSLIGPIDLKFDVKYLARNEERQWFQVSMYHWDFGDGQKVETQIPEVVHSFNTKWTFDIKLTLEGVDSRLPDKKSSKPASETPKITLSYMVKVKESMLANGGKTVMFDATELKPLGEIEWYLKDDLKKPAYTGYNFQPSKIYFEPSLIGMKLKNAPGKLMSRIFSIAWEQATIQWKIDSKVSLDNDLEYTFRVKDIENSFWDGFIENFTWYFDGQEVKKKADILHLEDSSEVTYIFKEYKKHDVKVILTNSNGKSNQISLSIDIEKKLKLTNQIEFQRDGQTIEEVQYIPKTSDYYLYEVPVPSTITFDAKKIRPENPLYLIDDIKWDVGNDGNIDGNGKTFEYTFNREDNIDVWVTYIMKHRRDTSVVSELKEIIHLELTKKEAILSLQVKPDSEYAPALVWFDASQSKVENDNIVKFIYDYGDGIVEERDAINPGHRYLKEGNYVIKLTVVTQKWKQYSTSSALILKSFNVSAKITTSMKTNIPVGQEIDFLSTESTGQIIQYSWDFWDGNSSSDANPSHAYSKPGRYQVNLTLTFANNNIVTDTTEVEVVQ